MVEFRENETNKEAWWEVMSHCDVFDGMWVKDDANPIITSLFRLNAKEMLELLRGKQLVYVGDSLKRICGNQCMVCLLRNSVEDKNRVFEVSGRETF
ncbi:hypothetical protein MTR67_006787 [Solanum verrucosum]|uniref:Trichome birefringence-like C-terminal domain-containing protein n=1 Tax=Solanum verrucosum TaxID=315347 RepID=A0AAF0TA06_SOLVR|nr:hypothetical protein MTR67_006787 [Solanum verrucosum]